MALVTLNNTWPAYSAVLLVTVASLSFVSVSGWSGWARGADVGARASEGVAISAPRVAAAESQPLDVPMAAVLARLNGEQILVADFLTYLTKARGARYLPSTAREADRLLRGLLRERLLNQEVEKRGVKGPEARSTTLNALIEEHGGRIELTDEAVASAFRRDSTRSAGAGRSTLATAGPALRAELLDRYTAIRGAAVLDSLLDGAPPTIDTNLLSTLVRPLASAPGSGPSLPPQTSEQVQ